MANERDDEQFEEKKEFGQDRQQPTGQQGQPKEFGQQGQQPEFGQQGQQPTGQQGQSSSGQAEPDRSGQTDTLSTDRGFGQGAGGGQSGSGQPGQGGGAEGTGGFVGSQGTGSDDYLREEGSTGGSDFASQGQGATEGATDNPDEDIETGQRSNRDSDIEGGSGNI